MIRTPRAGAAAGIVILALSLGTVGAGAGTSPPIELDPTSGPPGTVITVTGEDCATKGDTWVTLELLDTEGAVQDTAEADADESGFAGDWEATLTVPGDTTDYGEWTVEAVCEVRFVGVSGASSARAGRSVVAPSQDSSVLFSYLPAPFEVTEPAQQETTTTGGSTTTTEAPATSPIVAQPTYTG